MLKDCMSRSIQENVQSDDNIEESVNNLSELRQEIESIKKRKRQNTDNKNQNDKTNKPCRNGTIIPKPEDIDGYNTGEIRGSQVCVWVKDTKTGDCFHQWLDYPDSKDTYVKDNEYIRLCKCLGIGTDNPEDMLYRNIPIYTENQRFEYMINLPEYATKSSVIKHKAYRILYNVMYKLSNINSLVIGFNMAMYFFIFRFTLISTPSFIPTSGAEAASIGYPTGVGILIFVMFVLSMFVLCLLNVGITFNYTIPKLNTIYQNTKSKINKQLDDEYID